MLAARSPTPSDALRGEGTPGGGVIVPLCAEKAVDVYLSKSPPVTGNSYFIDSKIEIDAVSHVTLAVIGPSGCLNESQDLPGAWVLTEPNGGTAIPAPDGSFTANVTPHMPGQYIITFTACPNTCHIEFPPNPATDIPPSVQTETFEAVDSLPIPPQTQPVVPDLTGQCNNALPPFNVNSPFTDPFNPCETTPFGQSHLSSVCNGGGGVLDPGWVTVNTWHNQNDYVTAEGKVEQVGIAQEDDPFNHSSQDVGDITIQADLPYYYLRDSDSAGPRGELIAEWESGSYPEQFRPEPGDRISLFGYWIHDCGHDYHTEIHPPVGTVVDRNRAIYIPELGTNVWVPGVESDVFFNADGGAATNGCYGASLHQPASDSDGGCVPIPDTGGMSPLRRSYSYNIYLPPNPEDILKEVGKQNPPNIQLFVSPHFDPGVPQPTITFLQDAHGVGYLHVTLDLTNFTGTTLSGRIDAAWKYPAPDNWGLKQYQFKLGELYVREDSDWTCNDTWCPGTYGGDWHLWAMLNNQTEWTKLMAGDDNEFDDTPDYFGGTPWSTTSDDPNRSLGSDLLLFPEQLIQFKLTGFEDDGIETSDGAGTVSSLMQQPNVDTSYHQANTCTPISPEVAIPLIVTDLAVAQSNCTDYTAYWEVIPKGPLTGQLSAAGQAIYDASVVHASDLQPCPHLPIICLNTVPPLLLDDWQPDATHRPGITHLSDFPAFEPQEPEPKTWNDVDPVVLKQRFASAPGPKLDKFLTQLRGLMQTRLRPDHPAWEVALIEAALPPGKFQQFFGDMHFNWPIFGDTDCSGQITAMDALVELAAVYAQGRAECLNVGNVDCMNGNNAIDALDILRFTAGLGLASPAAADGCRTIGSEVHVTLSEPSTTPTPIPTPTPSPTPTPTPTNIPTPTPDTTGPVITDLGANPDGTAGHKIYDDPVGCSSAFYNHTTTLSATVTDPSGVNSSSVQLKYRFVDHNGTDPPANGWYTAGLEGTNPYGAQITVLTNYTAPITLQWYWTAQDLLGNSSTAPTSNYYEAPITDCTS